MTLVNIEGFKERSLRRSRINSNMEGQLSSDKEIGNELKRMLEVSDKTLEELGKEIGRSKSWVSNHLGFLGTKYEQPVEKHRIASRYRNDRNTF